MPVSGSQNFAFIANPLNVRCRLPIELIKDHTIRKANPVQIERIQTVLSNLGFLPRPPKHLYEFEAIRESKPGSFSFKPLPRKNWRYYVIGFKGSNQELIKIQLAANISNVDLELAFIFINGGMLYNPIMVFHYFDEAGTGVLLPEPIRKQDLTEIGLIYSMMKQVGGEFPDIKRAISMFDSLKLLPANSEFGILGMFSILELLITHTPNQPVMGDSIRHQVRTKIPLLSRRLGEPIDHISYFIRSDERTIWEKLYDYRSNIAHGGKPDFKRKLHVLKSAKNARRFLYSVTKALLRHSLVEPQLFVDLKKC